MKADLAQNFRDAADIHERLAEQMEKWYPEQEDLIEEHRWLAKIYMSNSQRQSTCERRTRMYIPDVERRFVARENQGFVAADEGASTVCGSKMTTPARTRAPSRAQSHHSPPTRQTTKNGGISREAKAEDSLEGATISPLDLGNRSLGVSDAAKSKDTRQNTESCRQTSSLLAATKEFDTNDDLEAIKGEKYWQPQGVCCQATTHACVHKFAAAEVAIANSATAMNDGSNGTLDASIPGRSNNDQHIPGSIYPSPTLRYQQ